MTRDPVSPQLSDLLARYLQSQASAHQEGLAWSELPGEVVPHESAPPQPVDPVLAWDGALETVRCFRPDAEPRWGPAPPGWPTLVALREPETALAFCAGNFPQLVRSLSPLLQTTDLMDLGNPVGRTLSIPPLLEWADEVVRKRQYPQTLLAAGALRLARYFDRARDLLEEQKDRVPAEWQSAWANEMAALAWHGGKPEEAAALWQAQPESVPVLFNRGMVALFLGQAADSRGALALAVRHLPEDNGWHHLGKLYLALAETRL